VASHIHGAAQDGFSAASMTKRTAQCIFFVQESVCLNMTGRCRRKHDSVGFVYKFEDLNI